MSYTICWLQCGCKEAELEAANTESLDTCAEVADAQAEPPQPKPRKKKKLVKKTGDNFLVFLNNNNNNNNNTTFM